MGNNKIYSIGHSTRSIVEFIDILKFFNIQLLVDIRRYPGSKKYPVYNKDTLAAHLSDNGIKYIHLEQLGGRRKVQVESRNDVWKNKSFQGYADYMLTSSFDDAVHILEDLARNQITVFMCSEAVWWRCHRSMVSDYLKAKGWKVLHIMGPHKIE